MDTWQEWQREYRFGVVLIFPPEPLLSLLNGLRWKHDPRSQRTCDAHISLTVPAPRPLSGELLEDLQSVTSRRPPMRIRYGPPGVLGDHPGVTIRVEPLEEMRGLVADLEATPVFRGATARRWPFTPHMTIAEFITREESDRVMAEIRTLPLVGEFACSHLSVAVPDGDFRFTERHRLAFGGSSMDSPDPSGPGPS